MAQAGQIGAVDYKDGACRCLSCFCVDFSCVACAPCNVTSLKICCVNAESSCGCGESCWSEERGCVESQNKHTCLYYEIQLPPSRDIGCAVCGSVLYGQPPPEQRTVQDGAAQPVDYKDSACRMCSCFCIDLSIATLCPCNVIKAKLYCVHAESLCTCCEEACWTEEKGYMEGKSKFCCLYEEIQCPPGRDIGVACCGVVCYGQPPAQQDMRNQLNQ